MTTHSTKELQKRPEVIQLRAFPVSNEHYERLCEQTRVRLLTPTELLALPESERATVLGLMPTILDPVDRELLDALPALCAISNYGAGLNHIDLAYAEQRGITVKNTPGVLSAATADLTFGLILATCRRMVSSDRIMRDQAFSGWTPDYHLGLEVTGRTLGLVGMGDIGQAVAKRAMGFDMPILYHNRQRLPQSIESRYNAQYCSFEALLQQSDIVSVHTPLTPETHHLFNADTFSQMKPGSVLINTARGPVVDEQALVNALQSRHLYAAGLDVYEQEPKVHPDLITMEQVVLTAHIGSATDTTRQNMGDLTVQNMIEMLESPGD